MVVRRRPKKPRSNEPLPANKTPSVPKNQPVLQEENKSPVVKSKEVTESTDDSKESVNYGYHPIIDFFDRYRWSAASKK